MSNKNTVESIYQAFGQGNVPAILEHLAENVEWDYASTSIEVPWLKRREGIGGAMEFFQAVGSLLEIDKFQVKEIVEGNRVVIALLDVSFTVRSTGAHVSEIDEIHVFRFNDEGKITAFRHGVDSYEHIRAFTASADTSGVAA